MHSQFEYIDSLKTGRVYIPPPIFWTSWCPCLSRRLDKIISRGQEVTSLNILWFFWEKCSEIITPGCINTLVVLCSFLLPQRVRRWGGTKKGKQMCVQCLWYLLSWTVYLIGTERHCPAAEVMAVCSPFKFKITCFLLFFVLHIEKETFREISAWADHILCNNGINTYIMDRDKW